MAFRVFLDVNVLLDLTLKRKKYEPARQLVEWIVAGRIQAFVTPLVISIAAYWLNKAYDNTKSKELLLALLADIHVISIEHEIAVNALHSQIKDIEDALQYYTALHYKLDYFITQDKAMIKASLPVLPACTPEEFIKNYS